MTIKGGDFIIDAGDGFVLKRYIAVLLVFTMAFLLVSCKEEPQQITENIPIQTTIIPDDAVLPENKTVRISVVESLGNSGLMKNLERAFEEDTNYNLEISSNSNSTAVSVARAGKADLLWILSGTAADQFVSAGYGAKREDIFHDYYVLAGPEDDPANVKSASTMLKAFSLIREEGIAGFVSRGDESDICIAEKGALAGAGFVVGSGNSWYSQAKTGMASSLVKANEKGAYILTEKEAFQLLKDELSIEILIECKDMKNVYTLISMNSEMFEETNTQGADAFREWLRSERAKALIDEYGISEYGVDIYDYD